MPGCGTNLTAVTKSSNRACPAHLCVHGFVARSAQTTGGYACRSLLAVNTNLAAGHWPHENLETAMRRQQRNRWVMPSFIQKMYTNPETFRNMCPDLFLALLKQS